MRAGTQDLEGLAKLVRYWSIRATAEAGSGHLTSSLSAADLMTALMFGDFFAFDKKHPKIAGNDRLIFSKGHASPLYYSLWHLAGAVSQNELLKFRKFSAAGARVQGHPTVAFPFAEATTGSLGQGLSIGVGLALNAKLDRSPSRTYVLIGDSEAAEGSVWEAMALAAHYKLDNLVAILDVNRLGQRGATMYGHKTDVYERKAKAFGWETAVIDGHDMEEVVDAYAKAQKSSAPFMIIAKTLKGKGVSFLEDKDGWHGKAPSKDEATKAIDELGELNFKLRGEVATPRLRGSEKPAKAAKMTFTEYPADKSVATRRAYGNALVKLGDANKSVIVLDAETSNSTYSEFFKAKFPKRFFEMFIAEQNMAGVAQGFSRAGKKAFASTFAAFLTRAFDQIRMGSYSDSNVTFCGSHAGVSIGEDGISQMGLEDIAMFRSVFGSTIVYPSDAVSTERLVGELSRTKGTSYIRTTRKDTPVIYRGKEKFPIGGCKVLREANDDIATIVAAGITVHEALRAFYLLQKEGIAVRVIDLYSVKPLDVATLKKAARETGAIVVVEDHYAEGGIGDAVASALAVSRAAPYAFVHLCVRKMAKSGKPDELLAYEGINAAAIVSAVEKIVAQKR